MNELVAAGISNATISVSSEVANIQVNVYEYLSGYALITVTSKASGNRDAYAFNNNAMYADSRYNAATEGGTAGNTVYAYLLKLQGSVLEGFDLTDQDGRTRAAKDAIIVTDAKIAANLLEFFIIKFLS